MLDGLGVLQGRIGGRVVLGSWSLERMSSSGMQTKRRVGAGVGEAAGGLSEVSSLSGLMVMGVADGGKGKI